jgi:CHAT domain-containing protein
LKPDTISTRSSVQTDIEDDLLMTNEIFNLSLPEARLVCLSACRTAGGRLFRGEGMVGLTRAFMKAGTFSLVTTLWDIDDEYTEKLMREFYHLWIHNSENKATALRKAQLKIIKEMEKDNLLRYPHPHRWAGFMLTGDFL